MENTTAPKSLPQGFSTQQSMAEDDSAMSFRNIMSLFLANWRWFLLSVIVALLYGVYYLLKTPSVYVRSAEVMIKEDKRGGYSSSDVSEYFSNLGVVSASKAENEQAAFKSPDIMREVVKRLHLNVTYMLPGTFHDVTLFGKQLPVNVTFSGANSSGSASMKIHFIDRKNIELTDFTLKGEKVLGKVTAQMGKPTKTPVGNVMVVASSEYRPTVADNAIKELNVVRSSISGATRSWTARLGVELENKNGSVLSLTMSDVNPARADAALNELITVYNEKWIEDKNKIAVSTSIFINERLAVIESELGNVDNSISAYKSENLVPDVKAASKQYIEQASKASEQSLELRNQLSAAQYIKKEIGRGGNDKLLPANSGLDDSQTATLIKEYNSQVLRRNNIVANSSTSNPLVIDLDESLASMRTAISASVDNQITVLNGQLRSMESFGGEAQSRIASNPKQAKFLLSVERQQKVKEALYLFLLQKREDNELSQAFTAYNTRVITEPGGSGNPASPKRAQVLLIALAIGLAIPAGVIYARESMNTKVRGRKDLENLSLPFIGEIPFCSKPMRKWLLFTVNKPVVNKLVVEEGGKDYINEAFRVLRTNIDFMISKDRSRKMIMFTSFIPGSGKTFLTMNIARSMAINGKKVLVIDGDMRHGSASSYVGSPKQGLSHWLSGGCSDWEGLLKTVGENENFQILPVGTVPPNPTELLEDGGLAELLSVARDKYDYILVDCPPLEMVADTQIIEKLVDRTVFVVRVGLLERSMLSELETLYTEHKLKNMCVALNGTETSGGHYGYRYGYRYGYGYHYGHAYGE